MFKKWDMTLNYIRLHTAGTIPLQKSSSPIFKMTSGHGDQEILGDALEFPTSKLIAKSRFLKGAMTERLASWDQHDTSKRGIPDEKLVRLYEEWGKGGLRGHLKFVPKYHWPHT